MNDDATDAPPKRQPPPPAPPATQFALSERLAHMREHCIECGACVRECEFLRRRGTPFAIAGRCAEGLVDAGRLPFECSLCGLCRAVCPLDLDPAALFLDLRRDAVRRGLGRFSGHRRLMGYEARGVSPRYSWYGLPEGCDTVFFPGCTMPGTRPAVTRMLFSHLASLVPNLGVVLDCCAKPSHDLGREDRFRSLFPEMRRWLSERGVRRVVVGCPNCHKVFSGYGRGLEAVTAYELLAEHGLPAAFPPVADAPLVAVHDPCPLRGAPQVHAAVRTMLDAMGVPVREMPHAGAQTLCCGEGGAVAAVEPELASRWGAERRKEAKGELVVSYCAGCVGYLGARMPAVHLLDALFTPRAALAGKARTSGAPWTYVNRLRIKRWFRRHMAVEHERVRPEGTLRD